MAEVRDGLDAALARQAEQRGIVLAYEDVWGRRRAASAKCVRAILAAMEAAGPAPAAPVVQVIREGNAPHLPEGAEWRLVEEQGRVRGGHGWLPADLPPGYPTGRLPEGQDAVIRGGSCIVGPLGELQAGPTYDEECILTADLDRGTSPEPGSTSTWWATTPGPTCSGSKSTSARSRRWRSRPAPRPP